MESHSEQIRSESHTYLRVFDFSVLRDVYESPGFYAAGSPRREDEREGISVSGHLHRASHGRGDSGRRPVCCIRFSFFLSAFVFFALREKHAFVS